ncbi:MAG: S-adenosylmethionine:tRNA ribosyltransferase-isomerase [Bacteroidota bacterium]
MPEHSKIRISDYSYDLPDERIARFPVSERDGSRLLTCIKGEIGQRPFSDLPALIPRGSLLVFNDTKVVRARLVFRKESGARIEIFCLEPEEPSDYQQVFSSTKPVVWKCLVGNARKWKEGELYTEIVAAHRTTRVFARQLSREGNTFIIRFSWEEATLSFGEILESGGVIPIPPYLQRESVAEDNERYQTVYSRISGSVAAPTAGLHFTDRLLKKLEESGVVLEKVTLHVGAGTFVPVKEEDASLHRMHEELAIVSKEVIRALAENEGRVFAVGTTTTRTLESLYILGAKLLSGYLPPAGSLLQVNQWDGDEFPFEGNYESPFYALIRYLEERNLSHIQFRTGIMITPGYRFRVINGMITNFHQPGSTLLLLIAAFIGERWRDVYKYALQNGFRFLSYGDSSLLIP